MGRKMKSNLSTQLLPWIERFVGSIPHVAIKTRQLYRHMVLVFVAYWNETPDKEKFFPAKLEQQTIVGWLKEMRATHFSRTVVHWAGVLTRFLSFLRNNGLLDENPLARLQKQYPRKGLKGIILALFESSSRKSLEVLQLPPRFASPLGPHMQKFIALGRSQGKKYRAEEYILCRFDCFLGSYSDPPMRLSDSILKQWLGLFSACRPEHRYKNFKVIRRFCLYLRRFDPEAYVPDHSLGSSPGPPFLPYIYSRAEVVALLKAARELRPSPQSPLRPQTYYLLILLLYTTGMRLGEVLKLELRDINRKDQALYIRETKFFKSRVVPLSSSMMRELESYLQLRKRSRAPTNPESPLFLNPYRQRPYSISGFQGLFRHMLRDLGLKPTGNRSGPRPHDLRATFAVHRLEEWYRNHEDVQSKLGLMSTYLGHVGISSTQRYLPMTTELLQHAAQRFEKYFTSTYKKGEKNENLRSCPTHS